MPTINVDGLVFSFQTNMSAQKYDEWKHYRDVWNREGRQKAIDVVAVNKSTVWLIEVKDFRKIRGEPNHIAGLAQLVAEKVRDSLGGLHDAAKNATISDEKQLAIKATKATTKRVVLHLEPHSGTFSKLFPPNLAPSVLQKLKQLVREIDVRPLVLNIQTTKSAKVPWTVC